MTSERGFDAAGRLCTLSRADRNRRRREQPIRTIGARSPNYGKPPDLREWHRAFRDYLGDVALLSFNYEEPWRWTFTIGAVDGPRVYWPHDGSYDSRGLAYLDRRKHPRRAASFVRAAVRRAAIPMV